MAKNIMIQGTMSNAGKSLLVAGLCRIMKQGGYRVAPFKSQNMALNSYITREGLEMGRAQVMQAEAAGIEPSVCMNPILLKPTNDVGSQVIVNGKVLGNMKARDYFSYKKELIPDIRAAYQKLEEQADIIVIEGAGSPAEINLKENDIVNMGLAELVDAPVLLVGDIDRGGVFAQLLGTLMLLEEKEKARVKGLIINKFRGDKTILDPGIQMLEEKGQIPVIGVVPYMDVSLEDEDSLTERFEARAVADIDLVVIHYPRISNFTDFDVFEQMEGVSLRYVRDPRELGSPDLIFLPGSKNTMGDLKWMRESGMEAAVKKRVDKSMIFGICGGYQMLGNRIEDPGLVEEGGSIRGLELLPVRTILTSQKVRTQVKGTFLSIKGQLQELSGNPVQGYEIHMGETCEDLNGEDDQRAESCNIVSEQDGSLLQLTDLVTGESKQDGCMRETGVGAGMIYGSYVHGLFDAGQTAEILIQILEKRKGIDPKQRGQMDHAAFKETQYEKLAEILRQYLDMDQIYQMMGLRERSEDQKTVGQGDAQGKIKVCSVDGQDQIERKIRDNWDGIAKPLDGLGELEHMIAKIGGIQRTTSPRIQKKAVVVMCADNGVVAQKISQSGQEVTRIVAENMAKGQSSVCHMAKAAGADVFPVDIGINSVDSIEGVRDLKIREGTRDFSKEPAMNKEEALRAIETGKMLVRELKEQGYQIIATGEMGIGNTTTSSAMAAALLHCPVEKITGRGAGLNDEGLNRKIQVIQKALERYGRKDGGEWQNTMEILCCVGGLDIAGLCGVFLGGAQFGIPIVIDGAISAVAALTAERLAPGTRRAMLPSHQGREMASGLIMEELDLHPVIDADLALGEGTGAVLLFSILEQAMAVYDSRTTFEEIKVEQYQRYK